MEKGPFYPVLFKGFFGSQFLSSAFNEYFRGYLLAQGICKLNLPCFNRARCLRKGIKRGKTGRPVKTGHCGKYDSVLFTEVDFQKRVRFI